MKIKSDRVRRAKTYYLSTVNISWLETQAKKLHTVPSSVLDRMLTEAKKEMEGIESVFADASAFEILDQISAMVKKKKEKEKKK